MIYDFRITSYFSKQLKPYVKKFRHFKDDILLVLNEFDKSKHTYLGNGVYKARLKSRDLPRGKSKSFRLIIFLLEEANLLAPIAIYFKGGKETTSKEEINYHLAMTVKELEKDLTNEN